MRSPEVVDYATLECASNEQAEEGSRERIVRALADAGMIAVRNVPGLEHLRTELLPQARFLAVMPDGDRKLVLKSNGLGTDVPLKKPDRPVSSFASQLEFQTFDSNEQSVGTGQLFRRLGYQLIDVGIRTARVCDLAFPGLELEKTIRDSQTAKGRLIHYHSVDERGNSNADFSKMWQQWHYDYGVLTVLTAPMFLKAGYMANPPDQHSSLLAMDSRTGSADFVNIPQDCVLVQVGEAAQILSGGRLRATAHCVVQPSFSTDVSRETFVVFLQPAWNKALTCQLADDGIGGLENDKLESILADCKLDVIPPLQSRFKAGWTFAEFSKQTTRQYYGSKGTQSNKI